MNRLLINMQNKVEVINGAIDMIFRLKKGETIELNGIHKMSFTAKDNINFDLDQRLIELYDERENLQKRINRM